MTGTTWNPSDKTGIDLSNGNLTASGHSFNFNGVRSTTFKAFNGSDKVYYEITTNGAFSDSRSALGFSTASATLGGQVTAAGTGLINEAGTIISSAGFGNISTTLGAMASKTYGFAIDIAAQKWWVTENGTTWNAGGTADPATGVGAVPWTTTQFSAVSNCFIYATIIDTGATATLNPDGSTSGSFVHSIPSGYVPWDNVATITGTMAVTEHQDVAAIFGLGPESGTFVTSEHQDTWSTSSGFDHLGVERAAHNNGAPLNFRSNGPNRILVYVFSSVGIGLAPTFLTAVTSTSGLNWQCEQTVIAGEDQTLGVLVQQWWWAYAPYTLSVNESITITKNNNNSTTDQHVGFAVSGLNGNYNAPWDWANNSLSEGSMIGAFFGGAQAINSYIPYSTGPFQGTTASYPFFTSGNAVGATLSFSGQSITSTGSGQPNNYAVIDSSLAKRSGKYYFEFEFNHIGTTDYGAGVMFVGSLISTLLSNGTGGVILRGDGTIWNGIDHGFVGAVPSNGDIIGCAVDFDLGLVWFKDITAGTDWNGFVGSNPAFGVLGIPFNPGENSIGAYTGGGTPPVIDGGSSPGVPVGLVSGSSSAEITFNFDNSSPSFSGTAPTSFQQWAAFGSASSFAYKTLGIEAEVSTDGRSGYGNVGTPAGFTLATSDSGTGSQRTMNVSLNYRIQENNVRVSDGPIGSGASTINWAMMFGTLVAAATSPGDWFSTEATDTMFCRGFPGAFGVIGDLGAHETPDAMLFLGFQRDSGIFVTTETPDIFNALGHQPLTGTFVTTGAPDRFSAAGLGRGENGVWMSTEGVDIFAAIGNTPISGSFDTTEAADRFSAIGAGVIRVSSRRQTFVT